MWFSITGQVYAPIFIYKKYVQRFIKAIIYVMSIVNTEVNVITRWGGDDNPAHDSEPVIH